jgi:quercetin dioxygenase-like cupin family protein
MQAVKLKYEEMPWKQFRNNTGLHYKPVKVEGVGFSRFRWDIGVDEAWHSHDQETQVIFCVSGRLEFSVDEGQGVRVETLEPGDVMLIERGIRHKARAVEATDLLIIFTPMNRFDADALIL